MRATIELDGDPEGYAVDEERGLFYTNLEDKDRTLAIDLETRKVVATWPPAAARTGRGPGARPRALLALRGLRRPRRGRSTSSTTGKPLGRLETGGGVDNLDYDAAPSSLLFVASGAAGHGG